VTDAAVEAAVEQLLKSLGYDTEESPHLEDTPRRVAESLLELTTPKNFSFTTFENNDVDQLIVVAGIPFYSLCAHHLLPFYGRAHIGYIPNGLLAGLSKLARTVNFFMRGLNIQEEMTNDIKNFLVEHLEPKGAIVVLEGHHLCMAVRGAQTADHLTTTSALAGVFFDPVKGPPARNEFFELIRGTNGRR
jgi:GTP cyclohydrolase I